MKLQHLSSKRTQNDYTSSHLPPYRIKLGFVIEGEIKYVQLVQST